MNNKNITDIQGGLHTDNSPQKQPKGTYRYALNAVNETHDGDEFYRSNEGSNEICTFLKPGFVPIGKRYIGNGETVIISVKSDDTVSEIGILKNNCVYETYVNDESSVEEDKLGFTVSHQVDIRYRLRRGCERTIYFTDDNVKPKYFNFDSLEDFKNPDGTWNVRLFNLQKQYKSVPIFTSMTVLDSGGNLEPGSYNVAIQYVDEGFNPTEWITTSSTAKIYNDLSNKAYKEVNGSINSDVEYLDFPTTGKAIQVNIANLDSDYLYYRLAFIESNNGSGQINSVKYTDVIATSKTFFIYTGNNAPYNGSIEEIKLFTDVIYKAKNIEQTENRLLLSNTEGSPVNFCKLQKYASRIKADCVTKEVVLNNIEDPSNPKNPTHEFGGLGYMPGEIYSFGIVYIFENGSLSPVYHIPGKSPDVTTGTIFEPGLNTHPMAQNNQGVSTYTGNNTCGPAGYWGVDSEGTPLEGKYVRHHRFPLRSEINKPLVTDELSEQQTVEYYQLILNITGTLLTPVECAEGDEDCVPQSAYPFDIRVSYKVNGEDFFFILSVNPATYADGTGSYTINILQNSQFHGSNNITDIVIEETDINGNFQSQYSQWASYFTTQPTYTTSIQPYTASVQGRTFRTEILGIKFSGIDLPSLGDTKGEKIIGYYIVRNERTEFDKTIIDSGVLVPSVHNEKYISHGLLQPQTNKIQEDVWGVIHPEHKFNDKEYVIYDEIIQQGNFKVNTTKLGKINYDDVYDGTSYNAKTQKSGNDDGHEEDNSPTSRGLDGWSLNVISRDSVVSYEKRNQFIIPSTNLKERFYLSALESRAINDDANDVYNISADNKIGIIQLQNQLIPSDSNLPYVVFRKNALDPYSNFRILPYYKESLNPHLFTNNTGNQVIIFNGDSYVSPMRYVNTMFWDNRVAKRKGRSNIIKIILGVVVAVIGTILAFFTAGASTILIGAGITLIGAGALVASSGIKAENANRAYLEEYDKGLRQTLLDDWVDMFYNYKNNIPFGYEGNGGTGHSGPSDDTIQWVGDCITDLWFESSVNISLRNHMTTDVPTYLDAPGRIESGNTQNIATWEFFGLHYTDSNRQRYPVSSLERHLTRKLLAFDPERDDNRYYIGVALGEWYQVNPDYMRRNKEKVFTHLALEYDCCTECNESFPHRTYYSEQSFQEELTDNYRVFLPNNYRDLEGESGEITNMFTIGNDLFLHTREALWKVPRSYQERITDQVVSFIGTGEYFAIPPIQVLDDETGNSAGSQHKWGATKTPAGTFFVSENQRKIYKFDGKQLQPISSFGMSNWFQNNIELLTDKQYYDIKGELYPYRDNPSNISGSGFISTYDSQNERLIFTKRDQLLAADIYENSDFELCIKDGQIIIFEPFSEIIGNEEVDGWNYIGINKDCQMVFEREVLKTKTEIREVEVTVPNTTHIYAFYDTSGSFNATQLQSIRDATDAWYSSFRPDDVGMTRLHKINSAAERWLDFAAQAASDPAHNGDILVLTFVNESHTGYHPNGDIISPITGQPTVTFTTDYNFFVGSVLPGLNFFLGITYPIATDFNSYSTPRAFVQHTLLAVNGTSFSSSDASAIINTLDDTIFDSTHKTNLLSTMTAANPYQTLGVPLKDLGWLMKVDRNDLDYIASDGAIPVITPEQFTEDINNLLTDVVTYEETEVEVKYLETEYKYIEGVVIENPIEADNSWTMSYSLKENHWISWHSYVPNFYIHIPDKFYSWVYNANGAFWKHNVKGNYQRFYNILKPFILEYTSLSNPLQTKIWDCINFLVESKRYNSEFDEFVDLNNIFFNKMFAYNSRQCTGLLNIKVKDANLDKQNYMTQQITNLNPNEVIVDRNERNWSINSLRDIRVDYSEPIFNSTLLARQDEYYTDKVLNVNSLDYNKDWTQLESFRDKYLAVRLIFDNFDNVKLLFNYSVENEVQSVR